MTVAVLQEWKNAAPGTSNYDALGVKLDVASNPPEGLITHTAGRDSNGAWRIFSIWDSREHAQRFQEERLNPLVQEMMQQRGDTMWPPETTDMYELHDFIHP